MIQSLYSPFRFWSEKGSVYIISDLHFEDEDCKLMDKNWISPEEHVKLINSYVHKNDTLVVLGDVGEIKWISKLRAGHKVLILGNHDSGENNYRRKFTVQTIGNQDIITYDNHLFDEVYAGPLMISKKIILSHVPIPNINWTLNIHGHDHNSCFKNDRYHLNVCSNVINYTPINLNNVVKSGVLNDIQSLNRQATNEATRRRRHS